MHCRGSFKITAGARTGTWNGLKIRMNGVAGAGWRASRTWVCTVLLTISGCGGGGGTSPRPPTPAVTLSASTVAATYVAGTSQALSIVATPTGSVAGTLYAKVADSNGVLQPTVTLTPGTGSSYTVGIATSTSLAAGHYTGTFALSLCYDSGCGQPVAGTPALVAFDFTVVAAYTLTPSNLSESFTAGSASPLTITVMPYTPFAAPVTVSLADPDNVLSPARSITSNNNGSFSITVQPASTLTSGHLTGALSLNLGGSIVKVPYDFTILDSPPAIMLSPASANGTFTRGDPVPFLIRLTATAATGISYPVYVSVNDPSGTFVGTAMLSSDPDDYYTLSVQANPSLAVGHYTGSFQLNLCNDQTCAQPLPGSPLVVPFDVQVVTNANAGVTPLVPWAGVGDWETFQRNAAHTGTVAVTLDPAVFATRWLWTAPNNSTKLSTLTTGGGRIYFNVDHATYALRESDSGFVWLHDFTGVIGVGAIQAAVNPPAFSAGKTFVTTSVNLGTYLFGFDAASGALQFQNGMDSQGEQYLAPTVDGGVVFDDGGHFGGMYAFDANGGGQTFFIPLPQYDEWTPAVDANYAYAYTGGVSSTYGQLNILDRHTGAVVGTINDPTFQWHGYSLFTAPVLGQPGSVFTVNIANPAASSLVAFNTTALTSRWQVAGGYSGNPAYAAPVLYAVNSLPYRLEARAETDGSLLWSWVPPLHSENRFIGDVLATNNLVFVSTNVETYAISQTTHQPVWRVPVPGRLAMSANGILYVVAVDVAGNTNGTVLAINVKN